MGIWTIGWGHAKRVGNDFLRGQATRAQALALYPGGITIEQAETLLRADLMDTCRDVESLIRLILADKKFAALVSFTFNVGVGNLKKSTLLRLVNSGDFLGAAREFPRWNKAAAKVLAGLSRRRAAEAELFSRA